MRRSIEAVLADPDICEGARQYLSTLLESATLQPLSYELRLISVAHPSPIPRMLLEWATIEQLRHERGAPPAEPTTPEDALREIDETMKLVKARVISSFWEQGAPPPDDQRLRQLVADEITSAEATRIARLAARVVDSLEPQGESHE